MLTRQVVAYAFVAAWLVSCASTTLCPGGEPRCHEPAPDAMAGAGAARTVMDGASGGAAGEGASTDGGSPTKVAEPSFAGDAGFDGPGFDQSYCDAVRRQPLDFPVTRYFTVARFDAGSDDELSLTTTFFPGNATTVSRAPSAVGEQLSLRWLPGRRARAGVSLLNWYSFSPDAGFCIEPGAESVRFQARGEQGGEVADFGVDGAELAGQVLSRDWQTFEIDLRGVDYNDYSPPGGVKVGFSVMMTNAALGEQRIYVDDMRWLGPPEPKCTPPLQLMAPKCQATSVAGAGGAPSCDAVPPASGGTQAERILIDDFEDVDAVALPLPNARARWVMFNDGSPRGVQYPAECVAPTPKVAPTTDNQSELRTFGCGFNVAGAGIALLIDQATGCASPFEGFNALDFMLDVSKGTYVELVVYTGGNTPVAYGGPCAENCFPDAAYETQSGQNRLPLPSVTAISAFVWVIEVDHLGPGNRAAAALPEGGFNFSIDDVAVSHDDNL